MRKKADTDKTEKIEAELVSVEIIDDGATQKETQGPH